MKKRLLSIVIALFFAFIFIGCKGAGSKGPGEFTKGISDLLVQPGENAGELQYSFSATTPAADSYTLYYIEGSYGDSGAIKVAGTTMPVTPTGEGAPVSITGLKEDTTYSIVVVAKKAGFTDYTSAIKEAKTPKFVPVSSISGVIDKIQYNTLTIIGGTVNPPDATYKNIIWSISAGNANASIQDGKLIATGPEDITLTATIQNGTSQGVDYTQDFEITVENYVEYGTVKLNITMQDTDFGLNDVGEAVFESQGAVALSSTNTSETISFAAQGLSNIDWYLGNIPLASNQDEFTLEYAAFNSGEYTLTIFFTKDGKRYSGDFSFSVLDN